MTIKTASVVPRLDVALKPLGFVRRKSTWNRKTRGLIDVIDIQVSKSGDAFTVNAGVLDPDVHATAWGTPAPPFVDEASCIVRARVGDLIDGKDRWWPLNEVDVAEEVAASVEAHVLPFLDKTHTVTAMEQFLVDAGVMAKAYPLPKIYLALLRHKRGETTEACAMLVQARQKTSGPWSARIEEVSERLRCSS